MLLVYVLGGIAVQDFSCKVILCRPCHSWLPTAAARVRAHVWSSGICGGQRGGFSPGTSVSIANLHSPGAGYNRPEVAAVPSGLSLTPLIIIIIIIIIIILCCYVMCSGDIQNWKSTGWRRTLKTTTCDR
jgi:hypothetical protein